MGESKYKLRHEYKHCINYSDYLALRQRLSVITRLDPHADENGLYQIRSLYFDNLQDKALREKIDGVNNREKFRIRYYNDNHQIIKLEKKSKINGLCRKQSVMLTKEQCEGIIAGDTGWMKDRKEPLIMELYSKMQYQQLRPKVIVDYTREPYIYDPGNVRITIDRDISTSLDSNDMFRRTMCSMAIPDRQIILEVKYDEFLPEIIANLIQLRDRRASAYSKYAVCRVYG